MATLARRKALALVGPATPMEYPSSARYIERRLPMNGFGRRITQYLWREREFSDLTRHQTDKYEVIIGNRYTEDYDRPVTVSVFKGKVLNRPEICHRGLRRFWQLLPHTDECGKALTAVERKWGTYYMRHVHAPRPWYHKSLDTTDKALQQKWNF